MAPQSVWRQELEQRRPIGPPGFWISIVKSARYLLSPLSDQEELDGGELRLLLKLPACTWPPNACWHCRPHLSVCETEVGQGLNLLQGPTASCFLCLQEVALCSLPVRGAVGNGEIWRKAWNAGKSVA